MRRTWVTYFIYSFMGIMLPFFILTGFFDPGPVNKAIQYKIGEINTNKQLDDQIPIYYPQILYHIYSQNNYHLIWNSLEEIQNFRYYISHAYEDGLNPLDYHIKEMERYSDERGNEARASLDILLTDAFLRFITHLNSGKIDTTQLKRRWVDSTAINPVLYLYKLQSYKIADIINEIKPHEKEYENLKKGLSAYRKIRTHGGWPQIPRGAVIHPGDIDQRIPLIRKRLQITGDLTVSENDTVQYYDPDLISAMVRYQNRNGLKPDSLIGPATMRAMNISVTRRIDQIRINMERWRWLPSTLGNYYLFVNLADFKLKIIRNNQKIRNHKIIIGRYYRKTPVIISHIAYLLFNPDWIVPPTILKRDLLPLVRKNPDYLINERFTVMDTNRVILQPDTIDWNHKQVNDYLFRQSPGRTNPLGTVEFIFPSPYKIFMHDTPSHYLFKRNRRMFSSGCIRVNHALKLAQYLLDDTTWTIQKMKNIIKTGRTTKVSIRNKPGIYIVYFTAQADSNGTVQFRNDIYHRDNELFMAFKQTPALRSSK